eukprot:scaffold965_cov344-Prasinococcus_capsulatus_cf.AAC.5
MWTARLRVRGVRILRRGAPRGAGGQTEGPHRGDGRWEASSFGNGGRGRAAGGAPANPSIGARVDKGPPPWVVAALSRTTAARGGLRTGRSGGGRAGRAASAFRGEDGDAAARRANIPPGTGAGRARRGKWGR